MKNHKYRAMLFGLGALLLVPFLNTSAQTRKPNIILILADDLGLKSIGCYGGSTIPTPNLDSLSKNGMRFTQCHSAPLCSPSRHMLLTGKYNCRNYTQWGVMDPNQNTIATILKAGGYKTACYGKWQLDGGDTSINELGFDNFCVHNPFTKNNIPIANRYKDPELYSKNGILPDSLTKGKYGEDIFADSIDAFIDNHLANPFFIYYPMTLSHFPFNPTPDDPNFTVWNTDSSNVSYFPSMVKYLDKVVGRIIQKLKNTGLEDNTYIFFTSDNGTDDDVVEYYLNGVPVMGTKGLKTEPGTLAPLIAYSPGKIAKGSINNGLIDFTDFLPTFSEIAKAKLPAKDTMDGNSFFPQIHGNFGSPREWIFNYYNFQPGKSTVSRWAQTKKYKLVDSLGNYAFFDILNDPSQLSPISDADLTSMEMRVKQKLKNVLDDFASISAPALFHSTVSQIDENTAEVSATIIDNGLNSVSERGTMCYRENNLILARFEKGVPIQEGGKQIGTFKQKRTGLLPQTLYNFRGYAINKNKIGLSEENSFYTLSKSTLMPPTIATISPIIDGIKIQWSSAKFPTIGANNAGYLILFSTGTPVIINSPNGNKPNDIILNGKSFIINSTLPSKPNTSFELKQINLDSNYNVQIIPFTWNGINPSTYNYFTKNILTLSTLDPKIYKEVFPNPTSGEFNLQISGFTNSNPIVYVTNELGKKVYFQKTKNLEVIKFGSNFSSGAYFITITDGIKTTTSKIIKVSN